MIKKEPYWKSYIVETTTPIFTPEQCNIISKIGRSMPPQNAHVGGGQEKIYDTNTRVSHISWIPFDNPEAVHMYKKLEDTGHNILSASFYINTIELPEEYVLGHVHKHYSNYSDPKEILYDKDGNVVDFLYGIYNLDILKSICEMIGWHKDKQNLFYSLWGRGAKAEVCIENINLYFKNKKN